MYDEVVAEVTALAQKVKVGDPLDPETQMGSLISQSHRAKVHGFRLRMRTRAGRAILSARRSKGRGTLSA